LDLAKKPHETSIAEGNLAEFPIFVLTNHEARPKALEAYNKTITLGTDVVDGVARTRTVVVNAMPAHGFPTMFASLVLHAIFEQARNQGLVSPRVHIGRCQIARRLGYLRPSKKDYLQIERACEALRSVELKFTHAWHDRARGRLPDVHIEGILSAIHFEDERLTLGEEGNGQPRSWVKLSDSVFESLRSKYFYPVDLDYTVALRSPLAQRLYLYLTKKDRQGQYVEGLKHIAKKLGLAKTSPSAILASLGPALDQLKTEMHVAPPNGQVMQKRFIEMWEVTPERGQLLVQFYARDTQRERARRFFADVHRQLELGGGSGGSSLDRGNPRSG
jgi:hypothetical protein